MRNRLIAGVLSLLMCLCLMSGFTAVAEQVKNTGSDVKDIVAGILAFKQEQSGAETTQDFIDNELVAKAGTGAEWYVIGLYQSGSYDFSAYREALVSYIDSNTISSASTRLKLALCLMAVDGSDEEVSGLVENSIGQQGIMSLVFGLHLINNGYVSEAYTADGLKAELLALQHEDGGWSITGQYGDVDVTAMTIQALALYYDEEEINTSVDKALVFLSERQLEDGDYASYGVANPESTAQVITALSSLGIDAFGDARFIKNENTLWDGILKYRLEDGSFSHTQGGESNETSTVQVFYSLVAYTRCQEGRSGIYILDDETDNEIVPKPTSVPDENNNENNPSTKVESSKQTADGEKETEKGSVESGTDYRIWVIAAVVIIAGVICLVLYLRGKKSYKSYLAVVIGTLLIILTVLLTDIKSADEYYGKKDEPKVDAIGSVTITIRCDTVLGKSESEYIPENGEILTVTEYEIVEGDTVYDILIDAAREHSISIDNSGNESMVYIAGINQLYEFDFGDLSGWMYFVNGKSQSVGCQDYELMPGDKIEWLYTCELGEDLE